MGFLRNVLKAHLGRLRRRFCGPGLSRMLRMLRMLRMGGRGAARGPERRFRRCRGPEPCAASGKYGPERSLAAAADLSPVWRRSSEKNLLRVGRRLAEAFLKLIAPSCSLTWSSNQVMTSADSSHER
jgi:hypothetical protein